MITTRESFRLCFFPYRQLAVCVNALLLSFWPGLVTAIGTLEDSVRSIPVAETPRYRRLDEHACRPDEPINIM